MNRLVLVSLVAACGASQSPELRADIQARMQSAQPAISACYGEALKTNGKLQGVMSLQLIAEPQTGQFKNIIVQRDELQNDQIRQCVVAEVGRLRLAKPVSTSTSFTYPLRFAPNN
jgi:hypothetical protein